MTYAELKAALLSWSHRSDLTARFPEFLKLADADINRRMRTTFAVTELDDDESNWLLDHAPDVYLHSGLMQIALATRDIDAANAEAAVYIGMLDGARTAWLEEQGLFDEKLATDIPILGTGWTFEGGAV